MRNTTLFAHLRGLEMELHQPAARTNVARLDELLHDHFLEFGKSGAVFNKQDILEQLPAESQPGSIWSEDYQVSLLAPGVALLTYKAARVGGDGRLAHHTRRSSIWMQTPHGWQLRFHQGTSTEPFRESVS